MQNKYQGINPHLNSALQTPGTDAQPALWPAFHSAHITHLVDLLNETLPDGYVAFDEQSLQIWRDNHPTPEERHNAVAIRKVGIQAALGNVVTRIELLSPANKPGGAHYRAYYEKRIEALQSGVPLVELDYLHESPPTIPHMPIYPLDDDAYPYYLAIHDPRPEWRKGIVRVFGFRVGDAIPTLAIPLDGQDTIAFDFDYAYQYTFQRRRWGHLVDYQHVPVRFETYRADDQKVIQQVMTMATG